MNIEIHAIINQLKEVSAQAPPEQSCVFPTHRPHLLQRVAGQPAIQMLVYAHNIGYDILKSQIQHIASEHYRDALF